MAADLSAVISLPTYRRLEMLWRNRTLPARVSRTLLEIWSAAAPEAVRRADQANAIVPLLASYAPALNHAAELVGERADLAEHEVLELAGLPLRFPH